MVSAGVHPAACLWRGPAGTWGPAFPLGIVSEEYRWDPAIQARSQRRFRPRLAAQPTALLGKGVGGGHPLEGGLEEGHPVLTALSSESGMDVPDKDAKRKPRPVGPSAASLPGDPTQELPAWLSRAPGAVVLQFYCFNDKSNRAYY